MKLIWCNGFPEIYAQLEEEGAESICHGYMCIVLYMKLIWCNGFPEIYAWLEEGRWGQSAIGICALCYIYVTGMKFGLRKRQRGSDVAIVTGDSGSDASRCTDELWAFPVHMCSGFPARRSKQMIVMSWNDVTVISCAILRGKYKMKAHTSPQGCHLGFLVLNGWVYS